jgi:hypothetical protein
MKRSLKLFSILVMTGMMVISCEGPEGQMGPEGPEGAKGEPGTTVACTECHNPDVVEAKAIEYEHSLHFSGVAYDEGTRAGCAPCHSDQGFRYVVKNNTPATFVPDPANAGKYLNNYVVNASTASLPGPISCFTCHSALHSTYSGEDFSPLTTIAAVPMTMWGGSKTINFAMGKGNLCAKCHQPRPITASSGNVIDYSLLVSDPATKYTLSSISYRTGIHYGAQGAVAAGVGGIQFGTGYTNSAHTNNLSCASCHMSAPSGLSGGHSFSAAGLFTGCNVTGCHSTMSATSPTYTNAVNNITNLLSDLATKINAIGAGHDILQKDSVDDQYHGYIDIYDSGSNPTGYWKNPSQGNVAFPPITNAQFGAILNYQLVFRDASKGVHNYLYSKKLLENTLAAW